MTWLSDWAYNGNIGKAIAFDGSDDYIDCGNDASLDITSAISMQANTYFTAEQEPHIGIVSKIQELSDDDRN